MTDTQFGVLLSAVGVGLAGIAAAIRWGVGRVTKAIDASGSSYLRLADAQIELASALSALRTDVEGIWRWIMMQTAPKPAPGVTPTPANLRAIEDDEDTRNDRPGSNRRRESGPNKRTNTAGRGVPVFSEYPVKREQTGPYRRPRSDTDEESQDR